MSNPLRFSINPKSVPESADLFLQLEELFEQVESVRDSIADEFNASPARDMMGGFITPGVTDLVVEWVNTSATVHIRSKKG